MVNLFDLDFGRWEIILLNLIPACINLGIFLYVSFFLFRNKANFAFSVFVLLVGLWQIGEAFMRLSRTVEVAYEWFRISGVVSIFVMPFGLIFILNYSKVIRKISETLLFVTLFLPSIICLLLVTARLDSYTMLHSKDWYWIANPEPTIITSIIYLWAFIQALLLLALLWISYKREKENETKRKQLLLLALGFTIPFVGGVFGEAVFPLILGFNDIPLITPLFTIFSIAALIAIKKFRMLEYSPRHQWDNIVETMNEGLLIVNNEDEIMYANKMFCEMVGYEFSEIKGRKAYTLLFDSAKEQELMKFKIEERKAEKSDHYEIQLKSKLGEKIWVRISGSPYYDNDGNIIGSIGILANINILKKAETRFRALVENVGDIIAMTDKAGKIIYVSPAIEKVTGFTIADLLGKSIFRIMHPRQVEESTKVFKELLLKPGIPIPSINCFLHKDGHYVWVEGTITNLLDDKNIEAIVSNYHDITERREAKEKIERNEKRYRALVENGADAVVILGVDGKATYVSPSVKRVLGYTEEEALQLNLFEVIYPEDIPEVQKVMEKVLLSPGIAIPGYTGRMQHKDGSWRWYESTVTNMLHDPSISGIIDNFREVTERKAAEQQHEFDRNNLNALINNTNDQMWSVDRNFNLITSNMPFDEMARVNFGKRIPKGGNVLAVKYTPEMMTHFKHQYERAFAGEAFTETIYFDYPLETWTEISYYPILQGDIIIGTACHSHDITEIKKVEKQLSTSESFNRGVLNALNSHISVIDGSGKILAVNAAWKNFSIENGETTLSRTGVGENYYEVCQRSILAGDAYAAEALKGMKDSMNDRGLLFNMEYPCHSPNEERWFSMNALKFDSFEPMLVVAHQDITKRKLSENSLKKIFKEISDYKYALDESSIVSITDKDGIITHVNDNFCRISKYKSEELIGQDHRIINSGYHSKEVMRNLWATISNGKIWKGELRNVASDGTFYWVDATIVPFLNEHEQPYQYIAIRNDITQRKAIEENLIKSETGLKEAQAIAHLGNWKMDFTSQIAVWSEEACRIYGLPADDCEHTFATWASFIHPEDLDNVMKVIDESRKTFSETILNYRIVLKDGTIKHIYARTKFEFDQEGKPIGIYGITHDVTESIIAEQLIKENNERYELAARATNDVLWDWDIVANKIYRSDSFYEQFGHTPSSENVYDDSWINNVHAEDNAQAMNHLTDTLNDPKAHIWESEYRFYKQDGTLTYIKDKGLIIRDGNGKAVRMVGAMADVSNQKKSELQLNKLYNISMEQNTRLQNFAYIVSHNIRSHSANMSGLVDIFWQNRDKEGMDKFYNMLKTSTDKLGETVENLNEIITIQTDTGKRMTEVNLRLEVVKTCNSINALILQTDTKIINDIPGNTAVKVVSSYLESILLNLLSNAINYRSQDRPAIISISARKEGDYIALTIQDNGIGIDLKKNGSKLFGMYKTFNKNKDARGLGLFITKNQIEAMSGRIEVKSELGIGTTFKIFFYDEKN